MQLHLALKAHQVDETLQYIRLQQICIFSFFDRTDSLTVLRQYWIKIRVSNTVKGITDNCWQKEISDGFVNVCTQDRDTAHRRYILPDILTLEETRGENGVDKKHTTGLSDVRSPLYPAVPILQSKCSDVF